MDWLPQPFSQLSGPAFLLVYAAFAAAVIIVSRLQVTGADRSLASPLPAVSPERDPYEIAYLRGGGNELLRFTIFEAMRRNLLQVGPRTRWKAQRIQKVPSAGHVATGPLLLDAVVAFYETPRTTEELFASPLPKEAEAWGGKDFGPSLEAEGFLTDAKVRAAATRVRWYGSAALVVFAGLRLLEAYSRHHRNVGFLLVMLVAALVLLFAVTKVQRLSRRGRAYLARLQAALRPSGALGPVAAGAALLPVFVAASGMGALAGTEFAPINKLFPARVSSGGDSGACGSGGGSSGSGGGCGSGCGGGCGG
jgi:uncharacterized protein (TIGR04222 family)